MSFDSGCQKIKHLAIIFKNAVPLCWTDANAKQYKSKNINLISVKYFTPNVIKMSILQNMQLLNLFEKTKKLQFYKNVRQDNYHSFYSFYLVGIIKQEEKMCYNFIIILDSIIFYLNAKLFYKLYASVAERSGKRWNNFENRDINENTELERKTFVIQKAFVYLSMY